MSNRYTAETLDLSRLPAFSISDATYEAILAERLTSLRERLAAHGVDYDVGHLEVDPLAILEQEDAYRELLTRAAVNDAARRVTLAYATGEALDHIAATYYADIGVRRLEGESDERFRQRIALAPEAKSPGTLGGYEYWARSATLDVVDALALNHASGLVRPGQIAVVVAGAPGANTAPIVEKVAAVVLDRDIKAASDDVRVLAAEPLAYDVAAKIYLKRGPDAALVQAEAIARLRAHAADRRKVGEIVREKGIVAALMAPAVEDVEVTTPAGDVDPGPAGIAELRNVSVAVEVLNG